MSATLQEELSRLTAAQKLLLIEDLWDEIAQDPAIRNTSLPEAQRTELDRRYEEFLRNPEEGSSWEEVRARILTK